MLRLGIGITTYNRRGSLARTLDAVARHTRTPHALVVADDGSTDGTPALLRERRVPHLTGPNRGIAWNKNRALFHLHAVAACDVVILLEDDTAPVGDGWERPWIEAAERWGHVNFAGDWFAERVVAGAGTPAEPFLCPCISGQCTAFARSALRRVGYMDTRFGRYGFEHCDHSERMLAAGYGGRGGDPALYYLLRSDLQVSAFEPGDYRDELERNALIYLETQLDRQPHRWPWRTDVERRAFLHEARTASLYDRRLQARALLARAVASLRWSAEMRRKRARSRRFDPVDAAAPEHASAQEPRIGNDPDTGGRCGEAA